jgi:riboflavin kinase / FMN adenylyltransferase
MTDDVELIRDLTQLPERFLGGAVTIGKFDGVHRGHSQVIARLRRRARQIDGPVIAFTFDPAPYEVLFPERARPPLTLIPRRAELLGKLGVDAVVAFPTDRDFLRLTSQEYFDRILIEQLQARAVVEGENFYFGKKREGNVDLLGKYCEKAGLSFEVVPSILDRGEVVSSSRVRQLILEGRLQDVNTILTQPYQIEGVVVEGEKRGRRLGYPTANLAECRMVLPAPGVYACGVRCDTENRTYPAAVAIGPNLTFHQAECKIEAHLIGFEGNLYGQTLKVEFFARLRNLVQFDTIDELLACMAQDVRRTKEIAVFAGSKASTARGGGFGISPEGMK